jgi:archaellum component FlaF (FlaF/FlaG flagellin family)
MEEIEYIQSGILELYVYGVTTESENKQVREMAERYPSIQETIISIENAVRDNRHQIEAPVSALFYDRLHQKAAPFVEGKRKRRGINWPAIFGWMLAIIFLLGCGYLYSELDAANNRVHSAETEQAKMKEDMTRIQTENNRSENLLKVIRNSNNKIVHLNGQITSPHSNAKIYWNPDTRQVYIDATGLPIPPEGMEYQVWSTANPLNPVSLGLLKDFKGNTSRLFELDKAGSADSFAITLETAGGNRTPDMDQLYVSGQQ